MNSLARSIAIASSLLLLTGCTATATPQPTESAKVYETAPLTGIQFEQGTNTNLALPSVACKIDNLDVARPQVNLNATDIVFDEMVEGGLTRFVAVWHSNHPTQVGPVRSIRPMDPDIISPLGGIVCFSGGQKKFVDMIAATAVYNASETAEQGKGTFTRASDREAPHNVIVDSLKLANAHTDLAPPTPMFTMAQDLALATAAASGEGVVSFKVRYPSAMAEWVWSSDKWLRNQDGKTHTDVVDGSQLSTTNVVVMKVKIDHQYGKVPKTVMVSTGTAMVFTGGKMVTGTWSKASQTAPIVLTDASGAVITLAPGRTWVELMPVESEGTSFVAVMAPKPSATPTK